MRRHSTAKSLLAPVSAPTNAEEITSAAMLLVIAAQNGQLGPLDWEAIQLMNARLLKAPVNEGDRLADNSLHTLSWHDDKLYDMVGEGNALGYYQLPIDDDLAEGKSKRFVIVQEEDQPQGNISLAYFTCPFCGGPAEMIANPDTRYFSGYCASTKSTYLVEQDCEKAKKRILRMQEVAKKIHRLNGGEL